MKQAKSTSHIPELDGVRACSILLVLAAHTLPLGPKFLEINASAGIMGMSLFFCLSGFLITSSLYQGHDMLGFFFKRAFRIVPALFLYLTVLLTFFDLPIETYVLNLAFVSNYVPGGLSGGPVGPLWSLSVEMHFYVAVGLTVVLLGRQALWLIVPACLLITGYGIYDGVARSIHTHHRVDEILIGGCLALFMADERRVERVRIFLAVRTPVCFVVTATLWFISSHNIGGPLNHAGPYLAGTLVMIAVLGDWPLLQDFLRHRIMAYIAKISYALYIWHPLMISGIMNEGSTTERYLLKRPISFLLTLTAAHFSTFWWEAWWNRRVRAWLANRTPASETAR